MVLCQQLGFWNQSVNLQLTENTTISSQHALALSKPSGPNCFLYHISLSSRLNNEQYKWTWKCHTLRDHTCVVLEGWRPCNFSAQPALAFDNLQSKRFFLMFRWILLQSVCAYCLSLLLSYLYCPTHPHHVFKHIARSLPSLLFSRLKSPSLFSFVAGVCCWLKATVTQSFSKPCLSTGFPRHHSDGRGIFHTLTRPCSKPEKWQKSSTAHGSGLTQEQGEEASFLLARNKFSKSPGLRFTVNAFIMKAFVIAS